MSDEIKDDDLLRIHRRNRSVLLRGLPDLGLGEDDSTDPIRQSQHGHEAQSTNEAKASQHLGQFQATKHAKKLKSPAMRHTIIIEVTVFHGSLPLTICEDRIYS